MVTTPLVELQDATIVPSIQILQDTGYCQSVRLLSSRMLEQAARESLERVHCCSGIVWMHFEPDNGLLFSLNAWFNQ